MGKFFALMEVLRKGSEVADPGKWKQRQMNGTIIAGFLLALCHIAEAFGYDIPVEAGDLDVIGLGVVAVGNIVLTMATSKKAGMPARELPSDGEEGVQPNPEPSD